MTLPSKKDMALIGLMLGIALCLRIFFLYFLALDPTSSALILDAREFHDRASEILAGNLLNGRPLEMVPLYPFVLALIYGLFGESFTALRLFQMLTGLASGLLIYLIAAAVYDRKKGITALALYAVYGVFIYFETMVLATTLSVFSVLLFTYLFTRALANPSGSAWVSAGAAGGFAALMRPNVVPVLAAAFLFLLWLLLKHPLSGEKGPIYGFKGALYFLIPLLPLLSLPLVFNLMNSGEPIPFTAHSGINFYLGNNPEATGAYMSIEGVTDSPVRQVEDAQALASSESGGALSYAEASRFWFRKGIRYLADNPFEAMLLYGRKFLLFWDAYEIPCGDSYSINRMFLPRFTHGLIFFGIAGPMALLGMIFGFNRKRPTLFLYTVIVTYILTIMAFHINTRYRLPVAALLLIFAAVWLVKLQDWIRARHFKPLFMGLILWAILLAAANVNLPGIARASYEAGDFNRLGKVFINRGQYPEAREYLLRAITLQPGWHVPYLQLGFVSFLQGELQNAGQNFRTAFSLNPGGRETLESYGNVLVTNRSWQRVIDFYREVNRVAPAGTAMSLRAIGNLETAARHIEADETLIELFREAAGQGDRHAPVLIALARRYLQKDRLSEALETAEEALALEPESVTALTLKARILLKGGDPAEAERTINRTLTRHPDDAEANNTAALILLDRGRLLEAEEKALKATVLDPALPYAHYNLAVILEALGKEESAADAYRGEIEVNPENYKAYNNLALLYEALGRLDDMEKALRKVIELRPALYSSYYLMARSYFEQGKNLPEAVALVRKSISLNPVFPPNHLLLANLHHRLGDVNAAEKAHGEYLRLLEAGTR